MKRILRVLIMLLVIAIILLALFIPSNIKINSVTCESQYGPCASFLSAKLSFWQGRGLPTAEKEIKNYLSKNPTVGNFSLQYKFPDIIAVRVLIRKPQVAVTKRGGSPYFLLDEKGRVLDKVAESNLPVIVSENDSFPIGNTVDGETFFAEEMLVGMFYMEGAKKGEISDSSLSISLENGPTFIFPLSGDKDVLLGEARLILSRLNNPADATKIGKVTIVDLRFKNPILR